METLCTNYNHISLNTTHKECHSRRANVNLYSFFFQFFFLSISGVGGGTAHISQARTLKFCTRCILVAAYLHCNISTVSHAAYINQSTVTAASPVHQHTSHTSFH